MTLCLSRLPGGAGVVRHLPPLPLRSALASPGRGGASPGPAARPCSIFAPAVGPTRSVRHGPIMPFSPAPIRGVCWPCAVCWAAIFSKPPPGLKNPSHHRGNEWMRLQGAVESSEDPPSNARQTWWVVAALDHTYQNPLNRPMSHATSAPCSWQAFRNSTRPFTTASASSWAIRWPTCKFRPPTAD